MSTTVATLRAADAAGDSWRWELSCPEAGSVCTVPLPTADPRRLLTELAEIDRTHRDSTVNVAVHARYVVVERFLDRVWRELIEPLVLELGEPGELRLSAPAALHRLPLTTARCARSGESLIHLCEPVVEWSPALVASEGPIVGDAGGTVRFDGHLGEVARALSRHRPPHDSALLLLGCRTAELLPWLPERSSSWAVVTSWDVDDEHCGALGDLIECGLGCGLPLASALRSAQAQLSGGHPYAWAGYAAVAVTGAGAISPVRDVA